MKIGDKVVYRNGTVRYVGENGKLLDEHNSWRNSLKHYSEHLHDDDCNRDCDIVEVIHKEQSKADIDFNFMYDRGYLTDIAFHDYLPYFLKEKGENKMEENKLDSLKKKFKELGTEIEKLEKAEKSKDDYVLKLVTIPVDNSLLVGFSQNNNTIFCWIGEITSEGKCKFLNNDNSVELYNLWREKGMKVCSDKVEWRGKEYFISKIHWLRCDDDNGYIYNFDDCVYAQNCRDNNIVRFKHNNKPIGF